MSVQPRKDVAENISGSTTVPVASSAGRSAAATAAGSIAAECPAPAPIPSKGRNGAPVWRQDDGAPVSCLEKIKVLNENYAELKQTAQDAFEDALLMGCSEAQVRAALRELIEMLDNPYRNTEQGPNQE